ncbi:MAG: heparan-alpha-glucosaminide N-acetyltransferase [Caldilineaceae bacterium]
MQAAIYRLFRMPSGRYWEIDTWRGIVVITMIIFHLMWDLWFFRVFPDVILYDGFWKYFQRFTACSFVFLAGVSLAIVYQRKPEFSRYLWRGLYVFGCGMIFSLAVWLFGIGYVHFGVLHMIGVSTILAYPLLRYKWLNVLLWFIFYIIGGIFLLPDQVTWWLRWLSPMQLLGMSIQVNTSWLVWLGLTPPRYYPVDFFPLFPYFGLVLLGVAVGNMVYDKSGRGFSLPDLSDLPPVRFLRYLGSHSLPIYMIHQPVLFAILVLLGIAQL